MDQTKSISVDDTIDVDIVVNSDLVGRFYLWSGVAQGEKFTYESGFIPIDLPALSPVSIQMRPVEPMQGPGDLVTMILSQPDWLEEHRLIRTITLNAYEVR